MAVENEIERRFLLKEMPDSNLITHSIYREMGYVITDNGELRVVDKHGSTRKYLITIKNSGGLSRLEWEEEIPQWTFNIVWPHTEGLRLKIIRHFINFGGRVLEVDEYLDNLSGLVKLECEFSTEESANKFVLPDWAHSAIDVTNDVMFNNRFLSTLDNYYSYSSQFLLDKVNDMF